MVWATDVCKYLTLQHYITLQHYNTWWLNLLSALSQRPNKNSIEPIPTPEKPKNTHVDIFLIQNFKPTKVGPVVFNSN